MILMHGLNLKKKIKSMNFVLYLFKMVELIEVDTNNKKVLDWAKTKGLT